jgi:16S rRNA (guanine(966)-N(2))-methyltransferase RsmD
MRVVGGSARGKHLLLVPGRGTRPIMDRVKSSLFDILRPQLAGMDVLDLFAGSGSVGIEALSQGAAFCTFTELSYPAIVTIKKNLANTGLTDRALVVQTDALDFLKKTPRSFDLIYIAPPQYRNLWSECLMLLDKRPELLRTPSAEAGDDQPGGQAVIQIHPKEYERLALVALRETRQRQYGNTLLAFFERA